MARFTLAERLLTQSRVLFDYALDVLLLPGGSELGLFHDDLAISDSWSSPYSTIPAIVGLLAFLCCAWWQRDSSALLFFYGVTFFLAGHSLEARPFALEIYFEHRNYLPRVGLWIAAIGLLDVVHRWLNQRWLIVVVVIAALGLHVVGTSNRAVNWSSWDGIVTWNLQAHPESIRAHAAGQYANFHELASILVCVTSHGSTALVANSFRLLLRSKHSLATASQIARPILCWRGDYFVFPPFTMMLTPFRL